MKRIITISFLLLYSALLAQEKQMVFQSRTDSSKVFSIRMADGGVLKMETGKNRNGLICGYTSSAICFKENKLKQNMAKIKAIRQDKTLTSAQKQHAYLAATFPDSVYVPYDSIVSIQFSLGEDKKYRLQKIAATTAFGFADAFLLIELSSGSPPTDEKPSQAELFLDSPQALGLSIVSFTGSLFLLNKAYEKTIYTRGWKLRVK
ncbi:MAG TPA: hypothetical protein VK806_07795 [Bacteroidia bacterium]|jgi:hypothetical protein|nr:hypothetical protein [Bacteroidia bacterium]